MLKVVGASWDQTRCITAVLCTLMAVGVLIFIFGEYEQMKEDGVYSATVYWSDDLGFRVQFLGQSNNLASVPLGIARAYHRTSVDNNGWHMIEIQSNRNSPDCRQAYAAGFLEGSLTWQLIYWHWQNMVEDVCEGQEDYCESVHSFLEKNKAWVDKMAKLHEHEDPFWHQIRLFYIQLEGLEDGWRHGVERSRYELDIPTIDFLWMNVMSDLTDLEQKFSNSTQNSKHVFPLSSARGLSSAFIKLFPETRQLFVAHNSGGLYQSMLRIKKRYELNYHQTSAVRSARVLGQAVAFTSYPGVISSQDDIYLVTGITENGKKHHLSVTGTAISNYNTDLWEKVSPLDQILVSPRVMAANRLATSGHSWSLFASKYNSGTGNKQWMIVDYTQMTSHLAANKRKLLKRKTRHHHEEKSLLWVVEQLPGLVHSSDQSNNLMKNGYWSVYSGIPFYKDISDESHTTMMQNLYGSVYSYDDCPVATIIKRQECNVTDVKSLQHFMRSNNYLSDPLSAGDPLNAIAGRGDLSHAAPKPAGVIDTKVLVTATPNLQTQFLANSGPAPAPVPATAGDNIKLQPFCWSSSLFSHLPHIGHPDIWNFKFTEFKWSWIQNPDEFY